MSVYDEVADQYDTTSTPGLTSAAEQARWIQDRVWPALRRLDDETFRAVAQPALDALAELPDGQIERRADADVVMLSPP
jgi:hypothetical protein